MSKTEKKTILKQIFKSITRKETLSTSEEAIKDSSLKDGKKEILKVVNKDNNRVTDNTLGDGAAIANNTDGKEKTLRENSFQSKRGDFKVKKADYSIEDLTKKEDIATKDVKPPLESDIDINKILKNLDGKLEEKEYHHVLNILTTRSSKNDFKESALVEYSVYGKSYVMSLIVEKDQDAYKVNLNSSYGKPIYLKEGLDLADIEEAVLFPFNVIALREKTLKEQQQ